MASNVPATTIRIDPEVKREAAAVLDELGLSMSGAMNIFLRAVIREGGDSPIIFRFDEQPIVSNLV